MRLDPAQLAEARAQLMIVKAIQGQVDERMKYAKTEEFANLEDVKQLAYVTVTSVMIMTLNDEVDKLGKLAGVEVNLDAPVGEQVIDILGAIDGNRRSQHRP